MRGQVCIWHAIALAALATVVSLGITSSAPAQDLELPHRVLWVDGSGTGIRSEEAVEELIATAQSCGFNTIVAVVRSRGDAHYRSTLEPRATNIAMDFSDPLQALLFRSELSSQDSSPEEALRILAGMNLLSVHQGMTLPPRGHMVAEFPEWVMEDRVGSRDAREQGVVQTFVDPSLPEVRQHTAGVALEIADIYGVDALVLDMARFPAEGSHWGYSAAALERYHREVGEVGLPEPHDPAFSDWRRDQVTALVRDVVRVVRQARPDLPIWIAVEAVGSVRGGFEQSETYTEMFQDWPRWIEEGLCDGIVLKDFFDGRQGDGSTNLVEWIEFARQFEDQVDLTIGVSGSLNYRNNLFNQMRTARAETANGSLALFDYDRPARDADGDFFPSLKRAIFQITLTDLLRSRPEASPEAAMPPALASPEIAGMGSSSTFLEPPMEVPMPEIESSIDLEYPAPITEEQDSLDDVEEIRPGDLSTMLPPPSEMPGDDFHLVPRPTIAERDSEEYSASDLFDGTLPMEPAEPVARTGIFDEVPEPSIPQPAIEQILSSEGVDIVTLQDGRQLAGEILDEYDGLFVLRLESGNIIRIPASRVESVMRGLR